MAEVTAFVCGLCERRHLSKVAYTWCSVCEEGLCIECSEYHSVSKLSKLHQTLPIESYRKLPEFIRTLSKTCSLHDEPLELYCGTHQEPCCTECIATEHSLCPGTTLLRKTVKGVRDSEYLASTKRRIAGVKLHAEQMKQNRRANIERLKQQRVLVCEELARIKDETHKNLTDIEAKLVNEINELVTSETKTCGNAESKMQDQLLKLQELEIGISEAESYGNEEQIYLSLKHLNNCLAAEETHLRSNVEDSCHEKDIEFILAEEMKLVTTIPSMGTIKLNVKPGVICSIVPKVSAQMFSPKEESYNSMTISNFKEGSTGIVIGTPNSRSMIQLSDGKIVLTVAYENDTSGHFYVFDSDGDYIERKFSFRCPFGLSMMNQKLIASFDTAKVAKYIDLADFSNISDIANGKIYGLSCYDNILAMAIRGNGITLSKEGENPFKTINVKYRSLAYIHLWKDKLFYSDFTEHYVYCLDLDGEEIWRAKFDEIKGPRNICTDPFGNVFVAAADSDAVFALSPDGKKCKKLLSAEDGMNEPKALYFNNQNSELLVANKSGSIFICSVKYHS